MINSSPLFTELAYAEAIQDKPSKLIYFLENGIEATERK